MRVPPLNEQDFPALPKRDLPSIGKPQMYSHIAAHQPPQNRLLSHIECSQIMSELLSRLPHCQNMNDQIQLIYEISFKYTYGSP